MGGAGPESCPGGEAAIRVERLVDHPVIGPDSHSSIGDNIQGPSLIRVPDWVPDPLGRYYLYFADHKGAWIRLAYADELQGPWRVHPPGALRLEDSCFLTVPPHATPEQVRAAEERMRDRGEQREHGTLEEITTPHIASPDVHVDERGRRFVMYFHGLEDVDVQVSRVALSQDGLRFRARPEIIDGRYLRAFQRDGFVCALAMPGVFLRSRDGLGNFEKGPRLFGPNMRHSAVLVRGDTLHVFWTRVGDAPERILLSTIELTPDWRDWRETQAMEVMRPERAWEGADAPLKPSVRSVAYGQVNQLRDPAVYEEDGRVYLAYAVAGESGIGLARIELD